MPYLTRLFCARCNKPTQVTLTTPADFDAQERILERKKAALEAECERLRREYRTALIDYERAQLGKRYAA